MSDYKEQKRTGATTTAEMLKNYNPAAAANDFLQSTKRKFTRPPFARFKLAWKTPEGFGSSIFSLDFHRTKENEQMALIKLKEWALKKKINSYDCFTATIYATLESKKDTSQKIYNYPLFHWILIKGEWKYQETAQIKFKPDCNKLDTYFHFYNPSTIQFGKL